MPEKTLSEVFGDIADAIREKTESQETMTPLEMADEISSILKPSGTITISESGSYNVAEYAEANVEVAGFEPEDSGWYYYDTDSKWYTGPSIPANTLVYATERGDECLYPDLYVDTYAYIYHGEASFEPMPSGFYQVDYGEYSQLDDGLCYINNDSLYSINLTSGNDYTYEGGSDFTPLEKPQNEGWYYYSISSGWQFEQFIGSAGVYDMPYGDVVNEGLIYAYSPQHAAETGVCHVDIALNAGSAYTYEGGSTFTPYSGGGGFEPQDGDGYYWHDSTDGWMTLCVPPNHLVYLGEKRQYVAYNLDPGTPYIYTGQAGGRFQPLTTVTTITINGSYDVSTSASVDVQVGNGFVPEERGCYYFETVDDQHPTQLETNAYYHITDDGEPYVQYISEGYVYYYDGSYLSDVGNLNSYTLYVWDEYSHSLTDSGVQPNKTYSFDSYLQPTEVEASVDKLYTYGQYGAINVNSFDHDVAFIVEYGGPTGDDVGEIDMSNMEVGDERTITINNQHRYKLIRLTDVQDQ